jgi:hypothetical protein
MCVNGISTLILSRKVKKRMFRTPELIKTLAGRFASLTPEKRLLVAKRLLEWQEKNQDCEAAVLSESCNGRRKSLLEQFWDEVESARGGSLSRLNPFARSQRSVWQFS